MLTHMYCERDPQQQISVEAESTCNDFDKNAFESVIHNISAILFRAPIQYKDGILPV